MIVLAVTDIVTVSHSLHYTTPEWAHTLSSHHKSLAAGSCPLVDATRARHGRMFFAKHSTSLAGHDRPE